MDCSDFLLPFMFQKLDIAIFIKKLNSSSIVFLTHTLKFIDSHVFYN